MTTQGTKEWADSNVNIYSGCSNNCLYCYAKGMAIRFNRKTEENWKVMDLNGTALSKRYKKRKGRIMFPTSHDITEETVEYCKSVLGKLLSAGNEVLVTTKPSLAVVKRLIAAFKNTSDDFRSRIQFRFTITTNNLDVSKYWEPGAPLPLERIQALNLAWNHGYKTSVSIEPFLGPSLADVLDLIEEVTPYCTESIWLGPMNRKFCPKGQWDEEIWGIRALVFLKGIINGNYPKVRYKDSFRNKLSSKA